MRLLKALLVLVALAALASAPVRAAMPGPARAMPAAAEAIGHGAGHGAGHGLGHEAGHHSGIQSVPHCPAHPDGMPMDGSQAPGACCAAWCAAPALPQEMEALRFPPPPAYRIGFVSQVVPGRATDPPLRPPRA
ncbi:MAG TPA: hypothetical protein VEB20_00370 [Azospirillaceae bacterium]|nr:hypothetical protein [Azospirillaceae bacterium]